MKRIQRIHVISLHSGQRDGQANPWLADVWVMDDWFGPLSDAVPQRSAEGPNYSTDPLLNLGTKYQLALGPFQVL